MIIVYYYNKGDTRKLRFQICVFRRRVSAWAKGELQRAVQGHLLSPLSCFWPHCLLPQDLNTPITYNPLSLSTMPPLSSCRNIVDGIDNLWTIFDRILSNICLSFIIICWQDDSQTKIFFIHLISKITIIYICS